MATPDSLQEAGPEMEEIFADLSKLHKVLDHPLSKAMDTLFKEVLQLGKKGGLHIPDLNLDGPPPVVKPKENAPSGDDMSDKDQELSLDDLGELEIGSSEATPAPPEDDGMSISLDAGGDVSLELGGEGEVPSAPVEDSGLDLGNEFAVEMIETVEEDAEDGLALSDDGDEDFGGLSLGDDDESASGDIEEDLGFSLDVSDDGPSEDLGDINLSEESSDEGFSLSEEDAGPPTLEVGGDDMSADLSFGTDESDLEIPAGEGNEISDEARMKMMEIDAIMDNDASQVDITAPSFDDEDALGDNLDFASSSASLDESLVSDDMNIGSLNFGNEEESMDATVLKSPVQLKVVGGGEEPVRKKKSSREADSELREDFREISGAYNGEMERTQATISNLRADRSELLAKIQLLEDDKMVHNRQQLTLRAELDERKIELSIIRKKLNEEIGDLKNRLMMQDERKLILEEKNRILLQELDKAGQKNKIDLKKVQMRERELEQKLELLKADAETQIKNRDLKILELKRKIDAMEFDMESISQQEKRSVESRYELEDKLDKAIKTLRSAISTLEDESDRGSALSALKKNIDV